ncbi:hypothetical protein [Nocardia sp. NPDC050710]|uniref:hypothetical protein n=1 Tax=Nocardia sp. NPDC050710 TaxID=3157220 RepID=UPI0033E9698E
MSDIDPLSWRIDRLQTALGPGGTAPASELVNVRVGPDGALEAIHLTDAGRRIDPDILVTEIVRVHARALTESRAAIAAAIADIENDPRLLALTARTVDALNQPLPAPPVTSAKRGEPTPEEDEEMDRYYRRKSWLEP